MSGFLLLFHLFRQAFSGSLLLSFGLLWIFSLGFSGSIRRKSVNESDDDLFDIHFWVELGGRGKERPKTVKVEFIGENLAEGEW